MEGDRWREAFSLGRIFTSFTREGLGNPTRDLAEDEQKLRELLQQGEADGSLKLDAASVPIQGAVVFINPAVELSTVNPSVPVVLAGDLKKVIRDSKGRSLSPAQVREVTDYLKAKSTLGTETQSAVTTS